ncbi:MAG: UDP-N-acetylmuramoyl-tripeptide--D-alanyl-D-alanine ligase, partial [Bacteroidales bacterium]
QNKILILGDMKELGETSLSEHQQIVDFISRLHFNEVLLSGEMFKQTEHEFSIFETTEELMEYLQRRAFENSYILIKGSRGLALERCVDYL